MIQIDTIRITPEILGLIAELDEFKGFWRASSPLAPKRLSILRRTSAIESIGSATRMAGGKHSDKDVEWLLANLKIKALTTRDERDVVGYAGTLEQLMSSWSTIKLTESRIIELHRELFRNSEREGLLLGHYKVQPNNFAEIGKSGKQVGVVCRTASPADTPRFMNEVVVWAKEALEARQLHPVLVIAVFTIVLLRIHPFERGNVRLSFVLITLLLMQAGYGYAPLSSIERVFELRKQSYYYAIKQTQGTLTWQRPNWQPWILFFLSALNQQAKQMTKRIEREKALMSRWPELDLRVLDYARENGQVMIGDIIALTGTNRNTLKAHFRRLLEQGQLVLHKRGRGASYTLP